MTGRRESIAFEPGSRRNPQELAGLGLRNGITANERREDTQP
jgi:hypothetical protein